VDLDVPGPDIVRKATYAPPKHMRFLCISDIHGHAAALNKVLVEARSLGFDQVVCCGDLLFPGPEPLATWKLLLSHGAVCVQGLSDAAVARIDPDSLKPNSEAQQARVEQLLRFHEQLGELIVARLARLATSARLPLESGHEMLIVHGSPADPTEAMTVDMDDDELNALLGDEAADIVVCGASHVPFQRQIGDTRIVNVGSVGEAPSPGIAYATIVESSQLELRVAQFEVEL
jgi:predicted phosphodiesterase